MEKRRHMRMVSFIKLTSIVFILGLATTAYGEQDAKSMNNINVNGNSIKQLELDALIDKILLETAPRISTPKKDPDENSKKQALKLATQEVLNLKGLTSGRESNFVRTPLSPSSGANDTAALRDRQPGEDGDDRDNSPGDDGDGPDGGLDEDQGGADDQDIDGGSGGDDNFGITGGPDGGDGGGESDSLDFVSASFGITEIEDEGFPQESEGFDLGQDNNDVGNNDFGNNDFSQEAFFVEDLNVFLDSEIGNNEGVDGGGEGDNLGGNNLIESEGDTL